MVKIILECFRDAYILYLLMKGLGSAFKEKRIVIDHALVTKLSV